MGGRAGFWRTLLFSPLSDTSGVFRFKPFPSPLAPECDTLVCVAVGREESAGFEILAVFAATESEELERGAADLVA